MKRKRVWLFLAMSIAWMLFFIGSVLSAAERDHALKVGKTGQVQFRSEVRVGDLTLKAGRYKLQHRVSGDDHFVYFAPWTTNAPYDHGKLGEAQGHAAWVTCRLEPLAKKASQTAVHTTAADGALRVTMIVIAGENVAHAF